MSSMLQPTLRAKSKHYDQAARTALADSLFQKVEELADYVETPRDLMYLTSAYSSLVEKVRLEEGSATQRIEMGQSEQIRERIADKLSRINENATIAIRDLQEAVKEAPIEGAYREVPEDVSDPQVSTSPFAESTLTAPPLASSPPLGRPGHIPEYVSGRLSDRRIA